MDWTDTIGDPNWDHILRLKKERDEANLQNQILRRSLELMVPQVVGVMEHKEKIIKQAIAEAKKQLGYGEEI